MTIPEVQIASVDDETVESPNLRYWNEAQLAPVAQNTRPPITIPSISKESTTDVSSGQKHQKSSALLASPTINIIGSRELRKRCVKFELDSISSQRSDLTSNDPNYNRFQNIVARINNDPQWDFQHNNVINLRYQSSADWYGELLSPQASKIFSSVISQDKRNIQDPSNKREPSQSTSPSSDTEFVVWFDRSMTGESRGSVVHDILWTEWDYRDFFTNEDNTDDAVECTPTSIADFLVQIESHNALTVDDASPGGGYLKKFPSFSNTTLPLKSIVNPTKSMITELAQSLKKDIIHAFINTITKRSYTEEKAHRFIDRFLQGHKYERFRVRKHFSQEVVNISRFPIALERKWEEFILAAAEELPTDQIELTRGLSKNEEMRFIYQIYGKYIHTRHRTRRPKTVREDSESKRHVAIPLGVSQVETNNLRTPAVEPTTRTAALSR